VTSASAASKSALNSSIASVAPEMTASISSSVFEASLLANDPALSDCSLAVLMSAIAVLASSLNLLLSSTLAWSKSMLD
jgi:hypothetical protein